MNFNSKKSLLFKPRITFIILGPPRIRESQKEVGIIIIPTK